MVFLIIKLQIEVPGVIRLLEGIGKSRNGVINTALVILLRNG